MHRQAAGKLCFCSLKIAIEGAILLLLVSLSTHRRADPPSELQEKTPRAEPSGLRGLDAVRRKSADEGPSETADYDFDAVIAAGEFVGQDLAAEKSATPSIQAGHLTGAAGRHAGSHLVAGARITGVLHAPSHAHWRRRLAANRGWLATGGGWLAAGRGGITTAGTKTKKSGIRGGRRQDQQSGGQAAETQSTQKAHRQFSQLKCVEAQTNFQS